MKVPTPGDVLKVATAQTEALLALPNLLVVMTNQLALFTEALESFNRLMSHIDDVVTEIEPGLKNLALVLEDPVLATVPDSIRDIQNDIIPSLMKLKGTADRFGALAEAGARFSGRRPAQTPQPKASSAAGSESESS